MDLKVELVQTHTDCIQTYSWLQTLKQEISYGGYWIEKFLFCNSSLKFYSKKYKDYCNEIDQGNISDKLLKELQSPNGPTNTILPVAHSVLKPALDKIETSSTSTTRNGSNSNTLTEDEGKWASNFKGFLSKIENQAIDPQSSPENPDVKLGSNTLPTGNPERRPKRACAKNRSILAKLLSFEDELIEEERNEKNEDHSMGAEDGFKRPRNSITKLFATELTIKSPTRANDNFQNGSESGFIEKKPQHELNGENHSILSEFCSENFANTVSLESSYEELINKTVFTPTSGDTENSVELWDKCLISALSLFEDYGVSLTGDAEAYLNSFSE